MSKIAVIYKGKYGSTEKYAKWISEEVEADLMAVDKCKINDLEKYDTVVFGGAVHAGGIMGIEFLEKNINALSGKNLFVFAVGLNVDDPIMGKDLIERNFAKKLNGVPCFLCKGAYDPKTAKSVDKLIMNMVCKSLEKKSDSTKTKYDLDMIGAVREGRDFTDKEYLSELFCKLREL